jgi:hypothetical protein
MGLYKLCEHKGRARDRCEHVWWAQFRKIRVSLEKWANREIENKTEANEVFDDLKEAVRSGRFDRRGINVPLEPTTLTFGQFADVYKERHVFAKALAIGKTIEYRLRPLMITSAIGHSRRSRLRTSRTSSPISASQRSPADERNRASCRLLRSTERSKSCGT